MQQLAQYCESGATVVGRRFIFFLYRRNSKSTVCGIFHNGYDGDDVQVLVKGNGTVIAPKQQDVWECAFWAV